MAAAMTMLVLSSLATATGRVTAVAAKRIGVDWGIQIAGSGLAKPASQWKNGAFVLHFDAVLTAKPDIISPEEGGIVRVAFSQVGSNVDVSIRPATGNRALLTRNVAGWLVSFSHAKAPSAKTAISTEK
ncbi:MAG TPA: hypothetical protein VMI31_19095, partial [Fimbriimonadaceae bacterium]|nr:hypothetical protein [Fimbriimonadaceae bacterium]